MDPLSFNGEGKGGLEDVLLAYLDAADSGHAPDRQRMLEAYPHLREELDEFFADEQLIESMAGPLRWAVQAALKTPLPTPTPFPRGKPRFCGGHELLEEIGRGGIGIVYRARDGRLGRSVALKLFRLDPLTDAEGLRRFRNETETIAQLDHPHIVPIYEVGEEEGRLYFSMKLFEGGSLQRKLPHFHSQPRATAQLVATVARAVHHAHQRGILHRDLKPANILLDGDGRPAVGDFGLAKRLVGDSGMTVSGAILGTPAYMAPEQAHRLPDAVTPATDVYGLGAILYALLTGRPPFVGINVLDTLQQVRGREPEPPSRSVPGTDRDLETICLKCLDKGPARRYGSAAALADDLERWLRGEPIQARRIGRGRRTWRWCRRNPVLAALIAVSILLAFTIMAGLAVSAVVFAGQRDELRKQQNQILQRQRDLRQHLYAADMRLAWQAWVQADFLRLHELLQRHRPQLDEEDLRTFAWYYLRRLERGLPVARTLDGHKGDVYFIAFSPDGKTVATAGEDGTVRLWDPDTGRQRQLLRVSDRDVNCVAFSPDSKTLATGSDDACICLWDCATARRLAQLHEHNKGVVAIAFSPDGKTLASAGGSPVVQLWEVASLNPTERVGGFFETIHTLAFAPDGESLLASGRRANATGPGRGVVLQWTLAGQQEQHRDDYISVVRAAAYSHDGRLAALGENSSFLHLAELPSFHELSSWRGHEYSVQSVAFSPDDKVLASAAEDGVHLWDVGSRSLRQAIPSGQRVWCVTFSPDGRSLAVSGKNGAARLYDLAAATPRRPCPFVGGPISEVALSPNGQVAAARRANGPVRTWKVATGELNPEWGGVLGGVTHVCLSGDGRMLLTAGEDRTVRLWETATSKPLSPPLPFPAPIHAIALSPDGALAAVSGEGGARFWDTATGQEREVLPATQTAVPMVFSADGKTLALVGRDATAVQLWDWTVPRRLHTLAGPGSIQTLAFSADGGLLAAGSNRGTFTLWDARAGQELHTLSGHRNAALASAFSPDGKTLATRSNDPVVKLWDVRTGQEVFSLEAQPGSGHCLAFTADGKALVALSIGNDGTGQGEVFTCAADASDEEDVAR